VTAMNREIKQYDGRPIGSKEQSKRLVLDLGLNTVESRIVTELDTDTLTFLEKYPLYGVRYMEFGRPAQYALTGAEAAKFLEHHLPKEKEFRVEQSLMKYDARNMLVQGEFEWGGNDTFLEGTYNVERGHSLKEINEIGRPLGQWEQYLSRFFRVKDILMLHRLVNVVVELTLYNCSVGMWGDDYIVWELRNKY